MKRLLKFLVGGIAVFVGAAALLAIVDPQPRQSAAHPVALNKAAICKAAVPMHLRLKDPASLRFDSVVETKFRDGSSMYDVNFGAKNSFGGYVLASCQCSVAADGVPTLHCPSR
jgi:hypothetical protein